MIIYLLKMMACTAIFYSFYYLVLSREKMPLFNRFYLLGSLLASVLIPLFTIEVKVAPTTVYRNPAIPLSTHLNRPNSLSASEIATYGLYTLLICVGLFLLIRLIKNLIQVSNVIRQQTMIRVGDVKVALLDKEIVPHSFWGVMFLNKTEFEQGRLEAEVIAHERAHIKQRHSLDILVVELFKVVTWFNPFIYLYGLSIKINHEFLADDAVLKQFDDVRSYQNILLQRASTLSGFQLASSFNFFTTKKRLIMLKKNFNRKRLLLALIMLLPVLILAFVAGCNRVEKADKNIVDKQTIAISDSAILSKDSMSNAEETLGNMDSNGNTNPAIITAHGDTDKETKISQEKLEPKTKEIIPFAKPKIEKVKFTPPKVVKDETEGPGVADEEMADYKSIVKEMKAAKGFKYIEGKTDRAYFLYDKMSFDQRAKVISLPPLPPPPLKKGIQKFTPPKIVKDEVIN
ncbi:MAG TPA: M56 family metallopeptidase [Niabella sp.]|nr:M56 family metallopeptidase [Niabella sp.]HQW14969.1 M56 family metallopeptidase [Niabella sp.]HQX20139.1 M56 family metallopeptidase [Niabella sp.]HRB06744.1 M56 family metallopeptidase [Niabella sp.]HRB27587.1 M56 family metallopeptidase [Niabella sp.]